MGLHSMKRHIGPCSVLPEEVRAATRAGREARTQRSTGAASSSTAFTQQPVQAQVPASSSTSAPATSLPSPPVPPQPVGQPLPPPAPPAGPPRRLRGKQARPANCTEPRRRVDPKWEQARTSYRVRYPDRQMSITDLPVPQAPAPRTCPWCNKEFENATARAHHSLACRDMPYDDWLRRVRFVHGAHESSRPEFPCRHCGTRFWTAKAAGRHGTTCGQRRTKAGLLLDTELWHALDGDDELQA